MGKELSARKRELARLTKEIAARKASIGRDLYSVGLRLARIEDEELWAAGGYDDFEDYLERGVDISRRSAYRFMRIASHFSAEIARRYGVTKLDAALRYLRATETDEQPGDLLASDILVRAPSGRYRSLPLHQASAAQIEQAARDLEQKRRARARSRIPRAWQQRAARLADRLPAAPPGIRTSERVHLSRASDGRLALSFSGIPADDLQAFVEALREELARGR